MADQEPFYSPNYRLPPPRTKPRPGEFLFEFWVESKRAHYRCELRSVGEWGVEAQFFKNGDLLIAQRFDTKALAVQWAVVEREHFEKGGE